MGPDSMATPALPRSDSVSALRTPSIVNAPALARSFGVEVGK